MTPAAIVDLLLDVSWRVVLVAALVAAAMAAWRVRSGAARHAAWSVVACVMVTMPAWVASVPAWTVPIRWTAPVVERVNLAHVDAPRETVAVTPASTVATSPPAAVPAQVSSEAREEAMPSATMSTVDAKAAIVVIWLVGVGVQVCGLLAGWWRARRLRAHGHVSEVDPRVYETTAVTAPCAVGLWRYRILMPRAWRLWPAERRAAVVRHELAHVTRRDGLVALLTRVNCAVFWFHPLAWWLERRVAAAAEQACDEFVLRAGHDPRRYAEALLDIAASVRRDRPRVAWHSLGMAGGRQLGRRIDAVLDGRHHRLSSARAIGLAVTIAMAVAAAAACRQAPVALTPDPEVTQELANGRERQARWDAIKTMTQEQADALEARFVANPKDVEAAESLLWYYRLRAQALIGWNAAVERRRRVYLTLVERDPESTLAAFSLERHVDPTGFEQARQLWDAHLRQPDVNATVFSRAVAFFQHADPERAERLLIDANTRFPDGTGEPGGGPATWRRSLGTMYARLAANTAGDAAQARWARAALDQSSDVIVLASAAGTLHLRSTQFVDNRPQRDAELAALAERTLARALAVDPNNPYARHWHDQMTRRDALYSLMDRVEAQLGTRRLHDLTLAQVESLPEVDRLPMLVRLSSTFYVEAESIGYKQKNAAGRMAKMDEARQFADRALQELDARNASQSTEWREELIGTRLVRGAVAWAQGDRALALKTLTDVADLVEAHGAFVTFAGGPAQQNLTNSLIGAGEIDAVATYFERIAPLAGDARATFEDTAAALRAGRMPRNYQRQLAAAEANEGR